MILYTCIAPGVGLIAQWGRNFDVNRNILSLWSSVASFKKISLKSDFIQFFSLNLYMYIGPGQGQTASRGQKCLVTSFICYKFKKKMSLKPDFIQFSS